jgi:uncharacterized protein (TIGR02271 family)
MATTQQSMVIGLFEDRTKAEQAVSEIKRAGFSGDQIEFAGHGVATGGFLDELKSLFTGHKTNEGVYNDLVGRGLPPGDARYYEQEYQAGRSIVAVTAGHDRIQNATTILSLYGAYGANRGDGQTTGTAASTGTATQATDVGTTANTTRATDVGTTAGTTAAQTADAGTTTTGQPLANAEGEQRLQLREEQLRVYKRPVQVGEVGLRKEVVTEQQTLNVPVTHEEVYIERRPVSGQVSDTPIGEGETLRIPVSEEQVSTSKQTVESGEIAIGKREVQEQQQVSDTVRREKARIEREGDAPIHETKTDPFHPSQADVEDLLSDQ